MEEQHHQLLTELEYRQQLQQLQQLHAQQNQQHSLNQLLAQNPHFLEEFQHQQQQFGAMGGAAGHQLGMGAGAGPDEYERLRHQLMLQRFHESQQQHQQEQFNHPSSSPMLAAMLNASQNGNRGGGMSMEDVLSRNITNNGEMLMSQQQQAAIVQEQQLQRRSIPPPAAPPAAPTPVQQLPPTQLQEEKPSPTINNTSSSKTASRPRAGSAPALVPAAPAPSKSASSSPPPTTIAQDARKNKKRSQSEATAKSIEDSLEDAPLVATKSKKKPKTTKATKAAAKAAPQSKASPQKPPAPHKKTPSPKENSQKNNNAVPVKAETEVDDRVSKLLESQKSSKPHDGGNDKKASSKPTPAEKKEKQKDEPPVKKTRKKRNSKEKEVKEKEETPTTTAETKKKNKTPSKSTTDEPTKNKESKKSSSSSASKKASKKQEDAKTETEVCKSTTATSGSAPDSSLTDHEKDLIRHLMVHEENNSDNNEVSSTNGKSSEKKDASHSENQKQQRKKKKKPKDSSKENNKKENINLVCNDEKEAAAVVLKFKSFIVSESEVQDAKKWNDRVNPPYVKYVIPNEAPMLTPELKFHLPSLPIEPENSNSEYASSDFSNEDKLGRSDATDGQPMDYSTLDDREKLVAASLSLALSKSSGKSGVTGPVPLSSPRKVFAPKKSSHEGWWPTNATIRRERRMRGHRSDEEDTDEEVAEDDTKLSFAKASLESAKNRMAKSYEPGVLEKIPHCKLYEDHCKKKYGAAHMPEPKFCCQVTENFLNDIMVCCSVCSTWRHAQCGGHYKHYSPKSVDPSDLLFKPICDQCYLEQTILKDLPVEANKRLDRQRIEHLRRANATNAVMRQASFAKHSGQYKWPLGSVSATHISGHTRSVQARHEKAEKQWGEMAVRLGGGLDFRPKERTRVRTRELERLLVSVEDAGKSSIDQYG